MYNNTNGTPQVCCVKMWQNDSPRGLKIQVEGFFFFLWIRGPFRQRGRAHYTRTHILKSGTEEIVFWHICLFRLHTFTWEGYTSMCVCTRNVAISVHYNRGPKKLLPACRVHALYSSCYNKAVDVSVRAMTWENVCLRVFLVCSVYLRNHRAICGKLLKRHLNRGNFFFLRLSVI